MSPSRSGAMQRVSGAMEAVEPVRAVAEARVASWRSRAAGLAVLAAVLVGLGLAARSVYHMARDSWVAPIHLSPKSDAVLQIGVKVNRELAEMARVEAELQRIDGDLEAIDAGLARLSTLRDRSRAPLAWQADSEDQERVALARVLEALRDEARALEQQLARQRELTAAARADLASGLVDRRAVRAQEQAEGAIELALAEKRRQIEEARHRKRVASDRVRAYRDGMAGASPGAALMPELAASDEHAVRAELELLKLEGEKRSLQALRRVAEQGLARERELLAELEARPQYRAIKQAIDVGFVPYDQLAGVAPGARVMACAWGLFFCREVGAVVEVLDGEVATLDPWGDMARGQYAILALDEPDAVREKVLRVRR